MTTKPKLTDIQKQQQDAVELRRQAEARRAERFTNPSMTVAPGETWTLPYDCQNKMCVEGPNKGRKRILMAGLCYTCATGNPRLLRRLADPTDQP